MKDNIPAQLSVIANNPDVVINSDYNRKLSSLTISFINPKQNKAATITIVGDVLKFNKNYGKEVING